MKAFKNFLLGLLVIASMSGCGLLCKQKQNTDGQNYGTSMKILYEKDFTHAQFDSICVADTLPMDLEQWKPYSSIGARYLYIALDTGLTKIPIDEFLKSKSRFEN